MIRTQSEKNNTTAPLESLREAFPMLSIGKGYNALLDQYCQFVLPEDSKSDIFKQVETRRFSTVLRDQRDVRVLRSNDVSLDVSTGSTPIVGNLGGRYANMAKKLSSSERAIALARFILVRGAANVKDRKPSDKFLESLDKLPDVVDSTNQYLFDQFFRLWGTHVVVNSLIGGMLEISTEIMSENLSNKSQVNVEASLEIMLKQITIGNPKLETSISRSKLTESQSIFENCNIVVGKNQE
eukprot:TRINITY_DN7054_c0_g1_i1.p1 TRINITY_DN7054_c0_g1~~TRINITY_DN7054_c0_g1_i1.p1  ORF type:complete len:240 (-),score=24.92 TRINITY_DN7054_c0_g1_i1:666-1385(-)